MTVPNLPLRTVADIAGISPGRVAQIQRQLDQSNSNQLHMIHFHDELLKDASINSRRKSNPISEWLFDYRPKDYRKILEAINVV